MGNLNVVFESTRARHFIRVFEVQNFELGLKGSDVHDLGFFWQQMIFEPFPFSKCSRSILKDTEIINCLS